MFRGDLSPSVCPYTGNMKVALLALSEPGRFGQQICVVLMDKMSGEMLRFYTPDKRQYWRLEEVERGVRAVTLTLRDEGYTVERVEIDFYLAFLRAHHTRQARQRERQEQRSLKKWKLDAP